MREHRVAHEGGLSKSRKVSNGRGFAGWRSSGTAGLGRETPILRDPWVLADRHPLSGRLPPPECRVRDSVAEAEVRKASPTDKDAEDWTGLASGGACRLLIVNCLFQQHPEGREVVIVRAGVVLPSVYERDQNHVLPLRWVLRRQRVEPSGHGIHLPPVVAPPLIVELDDRKLIRRAGYEAVKGLMLRVRHDPSELLRLDRREAFQSVIGHRHGHGAPPRSFGNPRLTHENYGCVAMAAAER